MSHPITLTNFKIGSDHFVIELIEESPNQGSVVITWPRQPLSISVRRFPSIAAELTRVISAASMELARIKAGTGRPGLEL
jgi:hypothetical protein